MTINTLCAAEASIFADGFHRSEIDHTTDRFAGMHQFKGIVDLFERHLMGDEIIDVDLTVHIPVDDFGHVVEADGGAFPHPTRK